MPNKIISPYKKTSQYDITVVLLDRGCRIPPETEAMLQALYSRSHQSVLERLEEIEQNYEKARTFMRKFYVGYGHKSIGDCTSATLFVEGASFLAIKALQDWRLFSGQESSTRYIDFSTQKIQVPEHLNDKIKSKIRDYQEKLRAFYLKIVPPTRELLRQQFPKKEDEDPAVYQRAINAKAFDICRGFLPSGMTSKTSWHMNFRQFLDALMWLKRHPMPEVREIASTAWELLTSQYPDSFADKYTKEAEAYVEDVVAKDYYLTRQDLKNKDLAFPEVKLVFSHVDKQLALRYKKLLETRPRRVELPMWAAEIAQFSFEFLIDFGSYRDIQRHRALVQRMPLVGPEFGFNRWYLENIPQEFRAEAEDIINEGIRLYEELGDVDPADKQYFMPLGMLVPNRVTGDLRSLVYLFELRVSRFVHPTVVAVVEKMAHYVKGVLKEAGIDLALHIDTERPRFDLRRGLQTIVERK